MNDHSGESSAVQQLAELFLRNGCVRPPAVKRRAAPGPGRFRRGFEFRFTARSREELRTIRDLLKDAKFKPGRPFSKGNLFCQPVYGRKEVERFLSLIGQKDFLISQ